jgi:hypothetical protein
MATAQLPLSKSNKLGILRERRRWKIVIDWAEKEGQLTDRSEEEKRKESLSRTAEAWCLSSRTCYPNCL